MHGKGCGTHLCILKPFIAIEQPFDLCDRTIQAHQVELRWAWVCGRDHRIGEIFLRIFKLTIRCFEFSSLNPSGTCLSSRLSEKRTGSSGRTA